MRLLIISHTPHHLDGDTVVGWMPTIREIDQLASRFTTVRHVACMYPGPAPRSEVAYTAPNVELVPVPPSGGPGLAGKLDVLRTSPRYIQTLLAELRSADVVHVRAPAHIAMMSLLLLLGRRSPAARWFKYAGNWRPQSDPPSYRLQRWLLRTPWHHGIVTVNGEWKGEHAWVRTFFNPSLTDEDLDEGRRRAAAKQLATPVQLLFVGGVERAKGAERAVEIARLLRDSGIDLRLDVAGDGPERSAIEARAIELGLSGIVRFRGWLPRAELVPLYAGAHFVLLPSANEGWPKVLSEGMAFGAVPLAAAVGSIPQHLSSFRCGAALPVHDTRGLAEAVREYLQAPERWREESRRAVAAAERFSFRAYLEDVDRLIADLRTT